MTLYPTRSERSTARKFRKAPLFSKESLPKKIYSATNFLPLSALARAQAEASRRRRYRTVLDLRIKLPATDQHAAPARVAAAAQPPQMRENTLDHGSLFDHGSELEVMPNAPDSKAVTGGFKIVRDDFQITETGGNWPIPPVRQLTLSPHAGHRSLAIADIHRNLQTSHSSPGDSHTRTNITISYDTDGGI